MNRVAGAMGRPIARRSDVVLMCAVALFLLTLHLYMTRSSRNDMLEQALENRIENLEAENRDQDLTSFLSEMRQRGVALSKLCAEGISDTPSSSVLDHLLANRSASVLFCPVPAAASITWLITLLQQTHGWRPALQDPLKVAKGKQYPKVHSFDTGQQAQQFRTRLLIVRHPFERLLSCYRNKLENANSDDFYRAHGQKMVRLFREMPSELPREEIDSLLAKVDEDLERERTLGNLYANPVGPTFTEFIKYVVSSNSDDEHWMPYHEHCAPCSIDYNFILKFENLSEEGDKFLQYLEAPDGFQQRQDNMYNGPPTSDVACSYFSQLELPLLETLNQKYNIDFQLYGYTADEYLKCVDEYVKQ